MTKKIIRISIQYILLPSLAIFLLFWAFKDVNPILIWNEIKSANYFYVALSFIFGYLAFILIGLRWIIVLDAMGYKNVPMWNSINSVTLTYLGNLMAPRAGEILRCTAMKKISDIPASKLLGTVILERTIDVIMFGLCFILTIFTQYENLSKFLKAAINSNTATKSTENLDYIFWIIFTSSILVISFSLYFFRKKLIKFKPVNYVFNILKGIFDGLKSILKLKKKWAFILYTIGIWFIYYLTMYFMALAFEHTSVLSFAQVLYLMTISSLALLIPVQGGLGAYHGVMKFGMPLLGIAALTPSAALAFGTLSHATQTIMQVVTGIIAAILISRESFKKINMTDEKLVQI